MFLVGEYDYIKKRRMKIKYSRQQSYETKVQTNEYPEGYLELILLLKGTPMYHLLHIIEAIKLVDRKLLISVISSSNSFKSMYVYRDSLHK